MSETLKIKFTGNNIEPGKVTANEFAKVVAAYENALLAVIKKNYPKRSNIDFISIVDVINESLTINAEPHTIEVKQAANDINEAISSAQIHKLPIEAIENLTVFQSFVNKYNCKAVLNGIPGIASAEINVYSDIRVTEASFFKGETTIYGKVVRIGGTIPKVRLELDTGKSFSVEVKKEVAKDLSSHLYETIAITGIAKWKKENNELVELKAISYQKLKNSKLSEKIQQLKDIIGKHWDNIDNPDDRLSQIRDGL
ncbi:hypothetical protein [Flavobacterium sp.]|uniref:hypothetical protein n=1 Tax=Flavobacterium sp. TaxID=239 RepID=UPI002634F9CC|nr:hypothetical protein [Flavobacterium sp.]